MTFDELTDKQKEDVALTVYVYAVMSTGESSKTEYEKGKRDAFIEMANLVEKLVFESE